MKIVYYLHQHFATRKVYGIFGRYKIEDNIQLRLSECEWIVPGTCEC